MSAWRIYALRAGRSRMDQSVATYLEGAGTPLVIPHSMFVLLGPEPVIVDTSFHSPEAVNEAYPQEIWRDPAEHPLQLLQELNLMPDDIQLVICTHLHYDHCGCNTLFSNARVVVQRQELDYALAPTAKMMQREFFSPAGDFVPPFDREQIDLVDGELELREGLQLLPLPGHTPGSQGVLVTTRSGVIGLPGDLIMVRENFDDEIPVGLHTNVDDWYRSLERLKARVDDVVPFHDMRVFRDSDRIVEIN
jgi:N-acyl homoserine lactone hydrolase